MVSAIVRWIKDGLGISALERENVQLAKALLSQDKRIDDSDEKNSMALGQCTTAITKRLRTVEESIEDHEARIAFLENSLTAKATTAKIVPKPHKATFRQFAAAASAQQETE